MAKQFSDDERDRIERLISRWVKEHIQDLVSSLAAEESAYVFHVSAQTGEREDTYTNALSGEEREYHNLAVRIELAMAPDPASATFQAQVQAHALGIDDLESAAQLTDDGKMMIATYDPHQEVESIETVEDLIAKILKPKEGMND